MVSGEGSPEGTSKFHGVNLDLYYGTTVIGTGRVHDYTKSPKGVFQLGNSTSAAAVAR